MLKATVQLDVIRQLISGRVGSYVTGSYIIGGTSVASDIDIVLPIDQGVNDSWLSQITKRFGGEVIDSDYNNGRKLRIPGTTTINILQLHPADYAAFMFATDTMLRNPIVTDRNARRRCFEELCHAYKSFINPGCVSVDEMYKVYDRHKVAPYMANNIDWENFCAR